MKAERGGNLKKKDTRGDKKRERWIKEKCGG